MYSEDTPSKRIEIINHLVNLHLEKLVRYSWSAVEEVIEEDGISESEVFSLTAGPVLMYFNTGLVIGVGSNPSKNSVVLWVEKNELGQSIKEPIETDEDFFSIDAKDSTNDFWMSIPEQKITAITILKVPAKNAKFKELPNEIGLLVTMNDDKQFILSHGLHDDSDDFSIIEKNQVDDSLLHDIMPKLT